MRRFFFMSLMLFTLASSNAYAFLDIFSDVMHYRSVKNHFVGALSNEKKTWKQADLECVCQEEKGFVFIPENEHIDFSDERFIYSEWDLTKSKKDLSHINDINSFYKTWFCEKDRSPWCTESILSQNTIEIRSESYSSLEDPMKDRSTHRLVKVVQVGPHKFISYEYQVRKKHLSEEEKKSWLAKIDWTRVDPKKLSF